MTAPRKFPVPERGPRRYRPNGARWSWQLSGLDIDPQGKAVPPRMFGPKPGWKVTMRIRQADGRDRCRDFFATTDTDAEVIVDRTAEEWMRGDGATEAARSKGWTVRVGFERWLVSRDDTDHAPTPAARAAYRAQFDAEIAEPLGDVLLSALTDERIREWKKGLTNWTLPNGKQQPRMRRTIQRYARLLRTVLRYAHEEGQLTVIPGDGLLRIRVARASEGGDQREHVALDDDRLAALLAEIRRSASPAVAMACRVASVIGLRDQEAGHLRCDALLLDGEVPHVWLRRHECSCPDCVKKGGEWTTKTSRDRRIPIPPELVIEWREYMRIRAVHLVGRDSQHVFPQWARSRRKHAGDQIERSTFNDAIQAAVKTLGISVDHKTQLLTFHTMRSVAATNLDRRSGGNGTAVSLALGWKLPGMSDRYNRLRDRLPELRDALFPDWTPKLALVPGAASEEMQQSA